MFRFIIDYSRISCKVYSGNFPVFYQYSSFLLIRTGIILGRSFFLFSAINDFLDILLDDFLAIIVIYGSFLTGIILL